MTRHATVFVLLTMGAIGVGCAGETDTASGSLVAADDAGGKSGAGGANGSGGATGAGGVAGTGGKAATGGATGAGGATGSGGATGTGGSADAGTPIEVAACDSLPGPEAGWHEITPAAFPRDKWEATAVVVDPYDQSVYASAGWAPSTGIQKSEDCGRTWKLISTGQNGDKLLTGAHWMLKIDPRPDGAPTLYTTNGYGNDPTVYKSTNGGVDFVELNPDADHLFDNPETPAIEPPFVHSFTMDPNDHQHLAAAFHANCPSPRLPLCFSTSHDGGATWKMFDGPAGISGWEEGASINVLGPSNYLYVATSGTHYTLDGGASWTKVGSRTIYCCYGGVAAQLPDGTVLAPISDGDSPIGASRADATNPLGKNWTFLRGSPMDAISMIDDGVRVFAGAGYFGVDHPYWSAPLTDLTNWTQTTTPVVGRSPNQMAYDPVHHVIYSANWNAGWWRLVTR
jgi:hypothetical protein